MGRLFGTDGVRGVTNVELTPEMAMRLGMAVATFFGEGSRILVGRDARAGGDMLYHAVVAGLQAAGARVYYAGYTPTPALQYAVKAYGFDGGVMVTASHNPPQYNGIKVIGPNGVEVSREDERKIEEIFFEERFRRATWNTLLYDVQPFPGVNEAYARAVVDHVDRSLIASKRFRVVVDCANSVTCYTTPLILRMLGAKALTVNCNIDPTFPGREPEPTPDTLAETRRIVVAVNADLGVAHDGDGDRAIIIDERGEAWWGDRTGTLLAAYIAEAGKSKKPKRIYTAVSSSTLVEEYLKPRGIEVGWTPVGSINISYRLLREGGIAGFEENGGFIYTEHVPVRDGGMQLALWLELMAREGVKASELYARLPKYYPLKTKIPMPREKALKAVEEVKKAFEGYRQVTIDGVKVFGDGWWVLVRPSGTEPVLRIMLEARTPEEAHQLLKKVKEIVSRVA